MFPPDHTATLNQRKMTEYFLLFLNKNAGEHENRYSTPSTNLSFWWIAEPPNADIWASDQHVWRFTAYKTLC